MIQKVLITGGAGFIGSHLSERFLSDGKQVLAIDNFDNFYSPGVKRKNIEALSTKEGYRIMEGDILDSDLLRETVSAFHPDLIIHLAARAGVQPSLKDPLIYQKNNTLGTNTLLEVMKDKGVRKLIFASSSSVYGDCPRTPFSEEDSDIFPLSPYGATKRTGENLCKLYFHLYDISIVCLRFFSVYGPRQRPDMAIHKFTKNIFKDAGIELYNQNSSRDYTYIDDIVQGIVNSTNLLGLSARSVFEIINLGNSKPILLSSLITIIEDTIRKKARIVKLPQQVGDVKTTFADITKAQKLLHYNPGITIEEGIRRFTEWFISNGHA